MTFIVTDNNNCYSSGKTLTEAYQNYLDEIGNDSVENLTFYEAKELKVELEIKKVEQITINKSPKGDK